MLAVRKKYSVTPSWPPYLKKITKIKEKRLHYLSNVKTKELQINLADTNLQPMRTSPRKRKLARKRYKAIDFKFLGAKLAKIELEMRVQGPDSVRSKNSSIFEFSDTQKSSTAVSSAGSKDEKFEMNVAAFLNRNEKMSSASSQRKSSDEDIFTHFDLAPEVEIKMTFIRAEEARIELLSKKIEIPPLNVLFAHDPNQQIQYKSNRSKGTQFKKPISQHPIAFN